MADPIAPQPHSVAGTLALLATTLGLLLLGATADREAGEPAASPPAAAQPQLDPAELARLGKKLTPAVARRVERIRELQFKRVPEPRLSTTGRLRRIVERGAARPEPARELAAAETALRMLGLLEPSDDLDEVVGDYGGAAAAYYEPNNDALFLLSDAVPAGPELVEFVLAHELTHALEDQAFGLFERGGAGDDAAIAELALTEGTATHLMEDYAARHLDPLALLEAATALEDPELPRFALAEIEFSYQEGARFAAALRRFGGWKLVDYALRERPPSGSEQVLHPAKYVTQEEPGEAPATPRLGTGWRALDRSEFGEFGTREVLEEGVGAAQASEAAAGWNADSYTLWRRAGASPDCIEDCALGHAFAAAWRLDTRRDAREFEAALRAYATASAAPTRSAPAAAKSGWGSVPIAPSPRAWPGPKRADHRPEPAAKRWRMGRPGVDHQARGQPLSELVAQARHRAPIALGERTDAFCFGARYPPGPVPSAGLAGRDYKLMTAVRKADLRADPPPAPVRPHPRGDRPLGARLECTARRRT